MTLHRQEGRPSVSFVREGSSVEIAKKTSLTYAKALSIVLYFPDDMSRQNSPLNRSITVAIRRSQN